MDELAVHVEHRFGATADDAAEAGRRLVSMVKNIIGVTVRASVVAPNAIERSAGKMRRIIDDRPR
jgi:phenylacetate-CoA ligase